MKEYSAFLLSYSTIGWPPSKIWNNVANWTFFFSISMWVFLLIYSKSIVGVWSKNRVWFFVCLQVLLLHKSLLLIFSFGKSFFTFLFLWCLISVSHLGAIKHDFLLMVLQTLHVTLWKTTSLARTPSTQGNLIAHSSWNF
jgi:hypothetical protein